MARRVARRGPTQRPSRVDQPNARLVSGRQKVVAPGNSLIASRTRLVIIVVATVFVAAVAACGGGRSSPDGSEGANSPATYNAGVGKVCNPSNRPGGTLRMGNSGDWDSFDPA